MKSVWSKKPAVKWEEAFPVGNGRLGAKISGTPGHEVIYLNEESIWSGAYINRNNKSSSRELKNIRELVELSRFEEAQELVYESFTGLPERSAFYESAGYLDLDFYDAEHYGLEGPDSERKNIFDTFTNYRRELDLDAGICSTTFSIESETAGSAEFSRSAKGSVTYSREYYVSATEDVFVIKITASAPKSIFLRAKLNRDKTVKKHSLADDTIIMECIDGVPFSVMATAINYGGKAFVRGDNLIVEKADEVLIYVDIETAYRKRGYRRRRGNALKRRTTLAGWATEKALKKICFASSAPYERTKAEHISSFSLLNKLQDFSLGENSDDISIEELIGNKDKENLLAELYWKYCKYVYFSSCQKPGSLPALPFGLWYKGDESEELKRYSLDYKNNSLLPGSMLQSEELDKCILRFIKKSLSRGRKTAEEMYGTIGYASHNSTDIWGDTCPCGSDLSESYNVTGGIAAGKIAGEFFEYNQDKKLLKKYWKVLKAACEFYSNYLDFVDDKKYLVVNPAFVSKEKKAGGKKYYISSENLEINRQVKNLFGLALECAKTLKISESDNLIVNFNSVYQKIKVGEKAEGEILKNYEYKNPESLYGKNIHDLVDMTNAVVSSAVKNNRAEIYLLPQLPENWKKGNLSGINLKGNILIDLSWDDGKIKSANVHTRDGKNFMEEITVSYLGKNYEAKLVDGALDLMNVLPTTVTD